MGSSCCVIANSSSMVIPIFGGFFCIYYTCYLIPSLEDSLQNLWLSGFLIHLVNYLLLLVSTFSWFSFNSPLDLLVLAVT